MGGGVVWGLWSSSSIQVFKDVAMEADLVRMSESPEDVYVVC